ncbi:MAG: type II toxin-antitoxin system VapC family toxin [Gemmatimonadota bacterium]
MSPMYLLDSNVYIHGFREAEFGRQLLEFHRAHLPRLVLSAVVVSELLVGAQTPKSLRQLRDTLVEPFLTRKRLLTPGFGTWERASAIDRRLRTRAPNRSRLGQRSFFHDILIAATASELGATIVTFNKADFELIARHVDIDVVEPWPSALAA